MEEENKENKVWGALPLKYKLIIIGVIAAFISIILFLVVMIAPLMELGIIDISGIGSGGSSSLGFSSVSSSTTYWWPIGGSEVEYINGKEFATGDPTSTTITCKFGNVCYRGHTGMDIGNEGKGSNYHYVIAALDGTVIAVNDGVRDGTGTSYGNYVKIQHSNGDITIYGHLYINSIKVSVGDTVKRGQIIGKLGHSGNSSGPHLHFEIRVNGSAVDPENYVYPDNPRPDVSTNITQISGDSNKQSVCLTLKNTGMSNNGVAAVMTNINHESSFNPTAQGDKINGVYTSYGLCQWHYERKTNLMNSFPGTYQTIGSQIEFLMYELKNGYSSLYNSLNQGTKSASDLTYDFCYNFERPADTKNTCRKRTNSTSSFLTYVNNGCR